MSKRTVNDTLKNTATLIQSKLKKTALRMADQHVKLAVTGLSGAGKTAFITSLVNQLLESNSYSQLPFFSVCHQQRLIGARRLHQPDLQLSRFAYEQAMSQLDSIPSEWPVPTRGLSQIRLQLKFTPERGIRGMVAEHSHLLVDIMDYPGELLLDLPLLDMDFQTWSLHSASQLNNDNRQELAREIMAKIQDFDWLGAGDELKLAAIAEEYASYLKACKNDGLHLIQPGRFVLPGDLDGAPILHFFPVISSVSIDWTNIPSDSNLDLLVTRYEQYKNRVVKPFYQDYFRDFDRQIVLVDCLGALNKSKSVFLELQQSLNWLLKSFDYGDSSLLNRLLSPKIDRLIFAASQADRITAQQEENLVALLESMVHQASCEIRFNGTELMTTAVAAIKSSEQGTAHHQGQDIEVIKGINTEGNVTTLYPGDVPTRCPEEEFWSNQNFSFPNFLPPVRDAFQSLPHKRMDQVLEFLLGDKLS